MELPIFQIDAFTDKPFKGNPAAVVVLEDWLPDKTMQLIASENNLSETAFICLEENGYRIRWFTPVNEVDLCGHATLASAYVIFKYLIPDINEITFFTQRAGNLFVVKNDDWLEMDFPSYPIFETKITDLGNALGKSPSKVFQAGPDVLAIYQNEDDIINIKPKIEKLNDIETRGVIVTAQAGENSENIDFISRFFAPRFGVDEDPVTGSAHCSLIPYWSKALGKTKLTAYQASKRGGILRCEHKENRVIISGKAVCVLEGNLIF